MKAVPRLPNSTHTEGFGTVRQGCRDTSPAPPTGDELWDRDRRGTSRRAPVSGPVKTEPRPAARARSRSYQRQRTASGERQRHTRTNIFSSSIFPTDPALMEERDGTRESAVRLRCPRRHYRSNQCADRMTPARGPPHKVARTGRTAVRSDDPAPTDTRRTLRPPTGGRSVLAPSPHLPTCALQAE